MCVSESVIAEKAILVILEETFQSQLFVLKSKVLINNLCSKHIQNKYSNT